ncbi:phytanoyl-CoA dioxygenase family protein [Noviherbaspirillum massiliense]|uniref:phytanoyl-CoA dioxygenase family protein n=1 Tax=Noviherbaspirillum massiliense TaxID=1465823 RepID=UPI0002E77B26|nr:phytanoyl-CoA dioxygenase family protein [Noviherbaspirillum massiliense]
MDERKAFADCGHVVLKGFFSRSEIAALSAIVDRIHSQWVESTVDADRRQQVNMHSLTSPAYFRDDARGRIDFFERIAPPSLTATMEEMFGGGLYFHNTQLFFNPSDRQQLPYWHRDLQYSQVEDALQASQQDQLLNLHVRVPLVKEAGVELVPGTHRRWDTALESSVRFERNGHRNSEDLPGARLIALDPGDILIFDAQMIHRGNYRLNETRKAFDICVGKPHPFSVQYLDASVLPDEQEIERIANNDWYRRARELALANSASKSARTD